jgi:hypothetical protein
MCEQIEGPMLLRYAIHVPPFLRNIERFDQIESDNRLYPEATTARRSCFLYPARKVQWHGLPARPAVDSDWSGPRPQDRGNRDAPGGRCCCWRFFRLPTDFSNVSSPTTASTTFERFPGGIHPLLI